MWEILTHIILPDWLDISCGKIGWKIFPRIIILNVKDGIIVFHCPGITYLISLSWNHRPHRTTQNIFRIRLMEVKQ